MSAPPPGKQECGEVPLAALEAVGEPLGKVARVLMEICSYAGEQWVVFAEYPTPPPHPPTHTMWWGSHCLWCIVMCRDR